MTMLSAPSMALVLCLLLPSRRTANVASFSLSMPTNHASAVAASGGVDHDGDNVVTFTSSSSPCPFVEWISDSTDEVTEWRELIVQGNLPRYVKGCLVRNGGGLWSAPSGEKDCSSSSSSSSSSYLHIFDGLAKVSAWRINAGNDDENGNGEKRSVVQYRNQFIQSNMYKKTIRQRKLPITITAGPRSPPQSYASTRTVLGRMQFIIRAIFNSPGMDNAPVNVWDYDPENTATIHGQNSNNHKRITARTDTPARAVLSLDDLSTLSTVGSMVGGPPVIGLNNGFVVLETAHPLYGITSNSNDNNNHNDEHDVVSTYNVATICTSGGRLEVAVIQERPDGTRTVVASHPPALGTRMDVPYIHSFALTERYVIIILQPLRLNLLDVSATLEQGFLQALHEVPRTEVMVFDLWHNATETTKHGSSNQAQKKLVFHKSTAEKVYFYHSVSASATTGGNDTGGTTVTGDHRDMVHRPNAVTVRLCAYRTADMITGEHHFLRLDQARGGEHGGDGTALRNQIPRGGTFCDITAYLDDDDDDSKSPLTVEWMDEIDQGFELPTTRYSRSYRKINNGSSSSSSPVSHDNAGAVGQGHPRYVYAYGAYADGSQNYDDWGIYKFDLHHRTVAARFVQPLHFPSEPIFVPNPTAAAESEDDGVVLVQMYDGSRKETGLFVLDGVSLQVVATVWTPGHRSPMDFHGGWIPSSSSSTQTRTTKQH